MLVLFVRIVVVRIDYDVVVEVDDGFCFEFFFFVDDFWMVEFCELCVENFVKML